MNNNLDNLSNTVSLSHINILLSLNLVNYYHPGLMFFFFFFEKNQKPMVLKKQKQKKRFF